MLLVGDALKLIDVFSGMFPLVDRDAAADVVNLVQDSFTHFTKFAFCWLYQSARRVIIEIFFVVFQSYKCCLFSHRLNSVSDLEFVRDLLKFLIYVFDGIFIIQLITLLNPFFLIMFSVKSLSYVCASISHKFRVLSAKIIRLLDCLTFFRSSDYVDRNWSCTFLNLIFSIILVRSSSKSFISEICVG